MARRQQTVSDSSGTDGHNSRQIWSPIDPAPRTPVVAWAGDQHTLLHWGRNAAAWVHPIGYAPGCNPNPSTGGSVCSAPTGHWIPSDAAHATNTRTSVETTTHCLTRVCPKTRRTAEGRLCSHKGPGRPTGGTADIFETPSHRSVFRMTAVNSYKKTGREWTDSENVYQICGCLIYWHVCHSVLGPPLSLPH